MYPVHKRTEIAFCYFFKLKRLVLQLQLFKKFIFKYISFSSGSAPSCYDYVRFPVRL